MSTSQDDCFHCTEINREVLKTCRMNDLGQLQKGLHHDGPSRSLRVSNSNHQNLHLFPREYRKCLLDNLLFSQLIDEMEPALCLTLSGQLHLSCSDSLKQHKKYSQMQEASQRDSQSYCPSFQTICTKRQAGSAEAQGQCSLWWSCLSVTSKGSRSSFRALQELI